MKYEIVELDNGSYTIRRTNNRFLKFFLGKYSYFIYSGWDGTDWANEPSSINSFGYSYILSIYNNIMNIEPEAPKVIKIIK